MLKLSLLFFSILSACVTASNDPTETDVIKQVSFDKKCAENKIKITQKHVTSGQGSYAVDACGKAYDYRHMGTVVFEKGHGPAGSGL